MSTILITGEESGTASGAKAQPLDVLVQLFMTRLSDQPDWKGKFEQAVENARARGASLDSLWRDLSLWLLDGHKHAALACAYCNREKADAVRWAISVHHHGASALSVHQSAQLAMHSRNYGAAGVYLMNSGSAAVAAAYASLAAVRDPAFIQWTLTYASSAMFNSTFGSATTSTETFWPLAAAKLLELINQARSVGEADPTNLS